MRRFSAIVTVVALSACAPAGELAAGNAWVRLPAVAGQPGAAYFTVQGGATADTLLAVSSRAALKAELHESMKGEHGMMSMAPLKDVAVPAGGKLAFAPGGRHVMLFSIGPAVKPGQTVPLQLSFASGRTLQLDAKVVGAGDPAPGS
ncbi:copper chaperone PCu(A)C [Sphingomonas sp. NPDC092331]|jgi:periplasmic copper chaperone A|uniref:copper chaperone PCu(A)C n=1 Tax=unclassified Sphingomonas TaxID=196159 RepID=UPI00245566C9|nr:MULTISPECIES: copper chaperone PCu(A)C [unclassified Sphingomonas]MBQ1498753.1 copper chaperone PCu(A)C [Sphingomonas sp.]MDH4745962.1 copper chaperone PCu(A)C [Sphingomonas sp. CBMAI 2297]